MGCGASRKLGSSHNDLPIVSICHTDTSYNSESAESQQERRNDIDDPQENGDLSQNSPSTSLDCLVVPECELFEVGEADNAQKRFQACDCKKKFWQVKQFNYDKNVANKTIKEFKSFCDRTVKLQVKYTSKNRPDTYPDSTAPYPYAKYKGSKRVGRCGTGFIYSQPSKVKGVRCPCPECANNQRGKSKMAYFEIKVSTAAHVIFDDSEASRTICEVFYDSEERETVKILYGIEGVTDSFGFVDGYNIGSYTERSSHDLFYLKCVSHDMASYKNFKSFNLYTHNILGTDVPLIVSHPHGVSKQFSLGTFCNLCLQLSSSHTMNTPYTIPVGHACVKELSALDYKYPHLFMRVSDEGGFFLTNIQPLRCFVLDGLVIGNKNEIIIRSADSLRSIELPSAATITDMDMTFEWPGEDFAFKPKHILDIFKDNIVSYYITYDTPTCSGSSGAFVNSPVHTSKFLSHHFGKDANGMNRTGDYSYTYSD